MEEEIKKDDGFWEEKNNKAPMLIIVAVLLALAVGGYIFVTKFMTETPTNNPSTKSDDVTTKSDEATISDDIVNENSNRIYIYAKGFADNGPIAFTYDCVSTNCNIITTEKGLILYDEEKVQYRELTTYEYDQIYNSDSPTGEKLEKDGFKDIVPTRIFEIKNVYSEELESTHNIYKIENINYFTVKQEGLENIYDFEDYCEYYEGKCIFEKQLIAYDNQIYHLEKDEIIHELEDQYIEEMKKDGSFVEIKFVSESNFFELVLNESNKIVLNTYENGIKTFYIKNEQIYYVKDNKVIVEDYNGNKVDYDNTNIKAVRINEAMLLYLDEDNHMNVRNLNTGQDVYNSMIVTKVELIEMFDYSEEDKEYTIVYNDYDVLKTDEWYNSLDEEESPKEELDIDEIKNCTNDNFMEDVSCRDYVIGYRITLDNNGKYKSKENYLDYAGL